ncbi:MAG: hypothetical protein IJK83_09815 [Clostridiales bacterium]|nr:hypothetical protein [Clostridiales bacterium]
MVTDKFDIINTKYGNLLPCSGASDYRKKHRCAVSYYDSVSLRSVYLEEPSVLSFPAGDYQTELITFYEDGNVKRIFPLYGQISAYWSIEEEAENAPYYDFPIAGEELHIRPQCIFFYPSGKIRAITLWPSDEISVKTPVGSIRTKLGVELYENGNIRSIEPVYGTVISTPEGIIKPYRFRMVMMHAENATLKFDEEGRVLNEYPKRNT